MNIRHSGLADRWLFCPEERIQRTAQIWHTVFSILNALQSMLLLFLVSRVCGSGQAGVFSLAFSIAYLMIMIGNYGVRNYQATDVSRCFGFREYRLHRGLTCSMMAAVSIGYVLLHGYERDKALVVLLCCLLKLIESVENVYHAEYQRVNRLDVAGKIGTIRIVAAMLVFSVTLMLSSNLVLACVCMDATAFILLTVLLLYTRPYISVASAKKPADWKKIFLICLPLFICTFFYTYICNASKYALDRFFPEEIQGYYGMIFMPVFAINLISNCIYGPFLVRLAEYWKENRMAQMRRFVRLQTAGILLISVVVAGGGYLLGTQVLSLIFGQDLTEYRLPLTILLAGSGMTALVDFATNMLTVIRKQNILMCLYSVFAVMSFACTGILVQRYGIEGAAYAYTIVISGQAAVMMLFVSGLLKKGNRQIAG